MKFLRIHYPTRTISLDYTIFVNKKAYQQLLNLISSQLNDNEQSLILYIIGQLYNPDISQRGKQQKTKVSFYELEIKWEKIISGITTTTPTSQKSKKSDFFLTSKRDSNEVSQPHSKSLKAYREQLLHFLRDNIDAYGIWISKSDRDHVSYMKGKLESNGVLFQKLVDHWNLKFRNKNGWEFPIRKTTEMPILLRINKNGYIVFWKSPHLSWELFFQFINKRIHFLTPEERQKLINILKDTADNSKLFYLETANLIGPADIIESKFNQGCLIYKQTYYQGIYYPVLVKIDKSVKPYEIEFQGPYAPTKRLQDLTINPFEFVQGLGELEFLQGALLEVATNNSHTLGHVEKDILSLQQQFLAEFSETQALVKNIDMTADLRQVEVRETLIKFIEGNNKLAKSLLAMNDIFDKSVKQQTLDFKNELFENTENILSGQYKILDQVNGSKKELVNSISSDHQEIKKEISKIQIKLDDLNDLIESNFSNVNNQVKNALYLVLRQIHNTPDINAKMISNQLKLGQRKVYYCLKKLQDQKLILPEIKKTDLPGRPSRNFKLNYFKKVK